MKLLISFFLFFSSLYSMENVDPELLDMEQGKSLYKQTCISCHGEKGDAKTALHLVVKPRDLTKSILSQQQIFQIIKEGSLSYGSKADIMPSFGTVFDNEQIANLSYYVFNTFIKPSALYAKTVSQESAYDSIPSDFNKGKKIFERTCSMCHGINGNGQSEYVENSRQDEEFIYPYNLQKILLNEYQIYLYAKYGGSYWGTEQDAMPSWKNKYSDSELKSVSNYIVKTIQGTK